MNFIKTKLIISLILILIASASYAGKPFRIGLKAGLPNVVSLNVEYVLPILGHRVAPTIDYSDFSISVEGVKADFTYFEAGVNVYLAPNGKWLYGNVSYINMKTNLEYSDLVSIGTIIGIGTATTNVNIKSFSLKLGAKIGGMFYIRPEVGYLFSPLNDQVEITATFPGGFTETQTEEIPSALSGSFIFNFGFGFAF